MRASLCFAETVGRAVSSFDARKALLSVENEVFGSNRRLQADESFDGGDLLGRVRDQALAVDKMHLIEGKVLEPAVDETVVDADSDRPPRRVHALRVRGYRLKRRRMRNNSQICLDNDMRIYFA